LSADYLKITTDYAKTKAAYMDALRFVGRGFSRDNKVA
jgi:hypothetical protein